MTSMRRILFAFGAGVIMVLVLVFWRHFFWQHAMLIGLAVTALVYSILRTAERMRDFYRH